MPPVKGVSGLSAKLGNRLDSAVASSKDNPIVVNNAGELPGGIEDGIAQLVECKFDTFKAGKLKGEYFFYAAGVVIEPEIHEDDKGRKIKVRGRRTSIMEPVCDTPDRQSRPTLDDHIAWVTNELKKLVGEEAVKAALGSPPKGTALEAFVTAVKEAAPYFSFRTWKGDATPQFPNPRVNHDWKGHCDPPAQAADNGTVDNTAAPKAATPPARGTGPAKPAPAKGATPPAKAAPAPAAKPAPAKAAPAPAPVQDVPFGDQLDMLGDKADAGDEDAQAAITEQARAAGIDDETIGSAENWTAIVAMIRGDGGEQGEDLAALGAAADNGDQSAADRLTALAEEQGVDVNSYGPWADLAAALSGAGNPETNGFTPQVGDVFLYAPKLPGNKRGKQTEYEVKTVHEDKQTVDLLNLTDKKSWARNVAFAEINPEHAG